MKQITSYIFEKIKELPNSVKGLIVFDIDDTLLKVDPALMGVYKKEPGKQEIRLTTDEFAKDPDAEDPSKKKWFDFRDFQDPIKVYNSIISGTPLIKNLKIMDDYIKAGYDFCFLTARGCEETIKKAPPINNIIKNFKNIYIHIIINGTIIIIFNIQILNFLFWFFFFHSMNKNLMSFIYRIFIFLIINRIKIFIHVISFNLFDLILI